MVSNFGFIYFGPDATSEVNLFCTAQGAYEDMYEEDDTLGCKVLLAKYHRSPATLRLGADINQTVIERKTFKSAELASGRNLHDQTKVTLKNFRKAKSFSEKYLDEGGLPKLSGQSVEQVVDSILQDMWDHEKNAKNKEMEEDYGKPKASADAPAPTKKLTESDAKYFTECLCGHDRAACDTCGLGYALNHTNAAKKGIGYFTEKGIFYLKIKDAGVPTPDEAAPVKDSPKKPATNKPGLDTKFYTE